MYKAVYDYPPAIRAAITRATNITLGRLMAQTTNRNPVLDGGFSVVTLAADCGNAPAIKLFGDMKIDLDAPDARGRLALTCAYQKQRHTAFDALLASGAAPTVRDPQDGLNTLERVAKTGSPQESSIIVRHYKGEQLDTRDCKENTPLLLAIASGRIGVALDYLGAGANPFAANAAGETVESLAKKYDFAPLVCAVAVAQRAYKKDICRAFKAANSKVLLDRPVKTNNTRHRKVGVGGSLANPARTER